MISNNSGTSRQAGIEEENIERIEAGREDSNQVPGGGSGEAGRRDPGKELDARSQEEEEEEGLPSYLQAVAAREDGAWLNLGYLP